MIDFCITDSYNEISIYQNWMKEIDKHLINCDALKTSQSNLFSDKDHYFLMNHFISRFASL